ncbi:MAG: hypothetical protein JST26_05735 [Bacteroidetes bacterium]|nr:hypothetical protein [Bacteroidota bacterium]
MLDAFNPEKQVSKRVQRYLIHKCTEENIDAIKAKLLIRASEGKPSIHLYEGNLHVARINFKSIFDFFGMDYEESQINSIYDYLVEVSKAEKIELEQISVVICEVKGTLGTHLYDGPKYRRKMSTLALIAHFNSQA